MNIITFYVSLCVQKCVCKRVRECKSICVCVYVWMCVHACACVCTCVGWGVVSQKSEINCGTHMVHHGSSQVDNQTRESFAEYWFNAGAQAVEDLRPELHTLYFPHTLAFAFILREREREREGENSLSQISDEMCYVWNHAIQIIASR